MEGAQCRAPCLRGTCEAWGGPGWWTKGRVLSRVCVGFLVCFLIKKRRCNGGGGVHRLCRVCEGCCCRQRRIDDGGTSDFHDKYVTKENKQIKPMKKDLDCCCCDFKRRSCQLFSPLKIEIGFYKSVLKIYHHSCVKHGLAYTHKVII